MRQTRFYSILAICCASWMAAEVAAKDELRTALATSPECKPDLPQIREFEVRVDNKTVGTHRLTIKSEGAVDQVAFQTDVKVDVVIYAYVFKFQGKEIWRDGRVEVTEVRCEDGGKKRSFRLKTEGCAQEIAFNGKSLPCSSPSLMTTAYWRLPSAEIRERPLMIVDVDTGRTGEATLEPAGTETITCAGNSLVCRHFKIDGPSPAELWFDDQDRLVCQKSVEQGHHMELRLKQIRSAKEEH